MINRLPSTQLLLRIGVAFAFAYPAVSAWFTPYAWVGYVPAGIHDLLGSYDMLFLHTFGIVELLLAVWFLSGKRLFIPSVVASVLLTLIIVTNVHQMDVLFRDIPILCMTLILALETYRAKSEL